MKVKLNKNIERFLQEKGFKGVASINESQEASLQGYDKHEHEGALIHAKQFEGFYRYSYKMSK